MQQSNKVQSSYQAIQHVESPSFFSSLYARLGMYSVVLIFTIIGLTLLTINELIKPKLASQLFQIAQTSGYTIIAEIKEKLSKAETTGFALSNMAESIQLDKALHLSLIPSILSEKRDADLIVGGGIWPEPYMFDENIERRSFFWGKNSTDKLVYFEDYNIASGEGYHNEAWYVPAKYIPMDQVLWSQAYTDPYTLEPMVTATIPMYRDDLFYGVATVDIRLNGLQKIINENVSRFSGYSVLLDRFGNMVASPDKFKKFSSSGLVRFRDVINKYSEYQTLLKLLDESYQIESGGLENTDKLINMGEQLKNEIRDIDINEARLIANNILSSRNTKHLDELLVAQLEIDFDPLLKESSTALIFNVPQTDWRLLVFLPKSNIAGIMSEITQSIGMAQFFVVAFALISAFIFLYYLIVKPLRKMSDELSRHSLDDLSFKLHNTQYKGEFAILSNAINSRSQRILEVMNDLKSVQQDLLDHNQTLENQVNERTRALEHAKKEAESATDAKSHFLATMSHEIRTPMNAIIGLAYLMKKSKLTHQQLDYMNKIQFSGSSLLNIINDILDFSKIEAGKLLLENREFNLHEVIEHVSSQIALKSSEKNLEVLIVVDKDIAATLVGDPTRLGQILINLASNAVKFTQSGEIIINISEQKRTSHRVMIEFSFKDTGIGIDEALVSQLFNEFTQVDSSYSRRFEGTGLGLAISKMLVNLMGGSGIDVKSKLNVGSTFSFKLSFETKNSEKIASQRITNLHGMHVLVVDDNSITREILKKSLESLHFSVDVTESGRDAILMLEQNRLEKPFYHFILMDENMPDLNGIETIRKIRSSHKITQMPIILMLTSIEKEEMNAEDKALDISGFLHKPINTSNLFNIVMDVMQGVVPNSKDIETQDPIFELDGRVLLVEDHPINQLVATEILAGMGLKVTVASDGQAAIDALNLGKFDVVLMDIQMPGMDGYEATKRIRASKEIQHVPIIALTAHAMTGDKEKFLLAGMNDHIPKPIDPSFLYETLSKWINCSPVNDNFVTSEPDLNALPDKLPGLNIQKGLVRLGNNRKLYIKLLQDFYTDHKNLVAEIHDAIAVQDFSLANRICHTIRGVSANLGAINMEKSAGDVSQYFKKNATAGEVEFERFEMHATELFDGLSVWLNAAEYPILSSESRDEIRLNEVLFEKLKNMMIAGNPETEGIIEKIDLSCDDFVKKRDHAVLIKRMSNNASNFDFDIALENLTQLESLFKKFNESRLSYEE